MIHEFKRFYLQGSDLMSAESITDIPSEVEAFYTVKEAVSYVQWLGCAGFSQHQLRNEDHELVLSILRYAIEEEGEIFESVLRGVRDDRPDTDHLILFGSLDRSVASAYGKVKKYSHVKGLRAKSFALSVMSDDYSQVDDEIIFFPF